MMSPTWVTPAAAAFPEAPPGVTHADIQTMTRQNADSHTGCRIAAATTNALSENGGRVVAGRHDRAIMFNCNSATRTAVARSAANREVEAFGVFVGTEANIEIGVATAAADRLRQKAVALMAARDDVAHMGDACRRRATKQNSAIAAMAFLRSRLAAAVVLAV